MKTRQGRVLKISAGKEEDQKIKKVSQSNQETDGLCEYCGNFNELLKVEAQYLCLDCRETLF